MIGPELNCCAMQDYEGLNYNLFDPDTIIEELYEWGDGYAPFIVISYVTNDVGKRNFAKLEKWVKDNKFGNLFMAGIKTNPRSGNKVRCGILQLNKTTVEAYAKDKGFEEGDAGW